FTQKNHLSCERGRLSTLELSNSFENITPSVVPFRGLATKKSLRTWMRLPGGRGICPATARVGDKRDARPRIERMPVGPESSGADASPAWRTAKFTMESSASVRHGCIEGVCS